MGGAIGNPTPEPANGRGIDETFYQDVGQQARAQERSSGRPELRLDLPGYEVKSSLGQGAYGHVWLAVQENTGREVAVKVFSRHKGLDWPLLKREVGKLVQVLSERRIVHLLAVGWDADPPYYIMEYVSGGSLAARLDGKSMPADEAIPLFSEVAEALVYLHSKAILHCDLKPSNVLLDDRGQVRLADFGQARLSDEEGPPAGTLFYMAPELTDGKARPDVRSDIYSLGAVLYTMLTGKPPYAGATSTRDLASTGTMSDRLQRYRDIIAASSSPADHHHVAGVDKALATIVDRCLHRDPDERFANVQQVLDALAARERHHAQRPLIAFGALGPAALLMAIFVIGYWAWHATLKKANQTVTRQALDNNRELVGAAAAVVDSKLSGIQRRVDREAQSRELANLLAEANKDKSRRKDLQQRIQAYTSELYKKYQPLKEYNSWFVADRDAILWARFPEDPKLIGEPFPYREWFNGRGNYEADNIPPDARRPRDATSFTEAYTSKASMKKTVISVGSPVKSADGKIVGVLAATFEPKRFNVWLENTESRISGDDCPSRFLVLINHRGQVVRHPCLSAEPLNIPVRRALFRDRPEVKALLRRKAAESYQDPLHPGTLYLAAASGLKENRSWFVIVQQNQSLALEPVHELNEQFDKLAWSAAAAGLAVVAALWLVLFQVIRAASTTLKRAKPAGKRS
jgi:eukaryotic-like serine/threonine-protein kinase